MARDRAEECIAPLAFLVAGHQPTRKNPEGNRRRAAVATTCRPALISPMSHSRGCHAAQPFRLGEIVVDPFQKRLEQFSD
jgi:hypothetical protein